MGAVVLALMLLLSLPITSLAVGKEAHGPDVYVIQGMLKSLGSYSGDINGYYDDATVQGVKYFQKKNGLPVSGAVDSRTLESITYGYLKLKGVGQGQGGGKSGGKGQSGGGGTGGGKGQGDGGGTGGGKGQGDGNGIGGGQGPGSDQTPAPNGGPKPVPNGGPTPAPNGNGQNGQTPAPNGGQQQAPNGGKAPNGEVEEE